MMDGTARLDLLPDEPAFSPVETVAGPLAAGALLICDHASNGLPPGYGSLGLGHEALERHIAYDIGAAALTRTLAARLKAPAVLSTFSRLLIDPNRGADDPTLVMRYSDGAIVPGNARADAAEIAGRRDRYWAPYREKVAATVEAMIAAGEPPAILSVHSFTPVWRGAARRWKVGVLWDRDDRLPKPLLEALAAEPDLGPRGDRRQRTLRRGARRGHDRRRRHRARPRQRADRDPPGPDRRAGRRAVLGRPARPPPEAHPGRSRGAEPERFRQPRPAGTAGLIGTELATRNFGYAHEFNARRTRHVRPRNSKSRPTRAAEHGSRYVLLSHRRDSLRRPRRSCRY